MKYILLFLLVFSKSSIAQLRVSDSQYLVKSTVLKNPGFEQAYAGWVITGNCTKSLSTNIPYLSASLTLVCVAQDFSVKQETTDLVGINSQLYLDAKIQASASGVIVRSLSNGSEQTAITLPVYDEVTPVSIPTTVGSTSNGVEISATSYTGTVYIDDLKLVVDDRRFQVPIVSEIENCVIGLSSAFGSPSGTSVKCRQVGGKLEVYAAFTGGTVIADSAYIDIPSGYTIDSSKLTVQNLTSAAGQKVGSWQVSENLSDTNGFIVTAPSTSLTRVYFGASSRNTDDQLKPSIGTSIAPSSALIEFDFSIPVNELSTTPASIVSQKTELTALTDNSLNGVVDSAGNTDSQKYGDSGITSTRNSLGNYTIDYTSLGLTVLPAFDAKEVISSINQYETTIKSVSLTAAVVEIKYTGNLLGDAKFSWFLEKQGADVNKSIEFYGKFNNLGDTKANTINLTSLPTYADDATAGSGGLVQGDVYQTATGELRVKL